MAIDLILILMLMVNVSFGRAGGGVISIILGYKWGHPKKVPMKKRVIIFYSSLRSATTGNMSALRRLILQELLVKSHQPPFPSHPMNGPLPKNYQPILIVLSAKPLKFRTHSFSVPLKYRSHSMTS